MFAFLVFPGSLHAGESSNPIERIQIPGIGTVDYQRLFEEVSHPGESMDDFALRVGPRLRAPGNACRIHFG